MARAAGGLVTSAIVVLNGYLLFVTFRGGA